MIDTNANLQDELEIAREQYRPTLTYDVLQLIGGEIRPQYIGFSANYTVKNIGNKAAYQTSIRRYLEDLNTVHDVYVGPTNYATNPIFPGEYTVVELKEWSENVVDADIVNIIECTHIRYSDAQEDGNWYEQTFWINFKVDNVSKTFRALQAMPEDIKKCEPFFLTQDAEREGTMMSD